MIAVFFFYGLAFFSLGLTAWQESRRASELPLRKQLPWLAAFGLVHACVEWLDMFLLIMPGEEWVNFLEMAHIILLPLSAILLVRFGIGLIYEAGPLPKWMSFIPVVLLVPLALLLGYALIVSMTQPDWYLAADIWSRYLLYLPGCLFSAFGFYRQWKEIKGTQLHDVGILTLGAGAAFLINAFVAGLIVPAGPYGLAMVLNYDVVLSTTGVPVQIWRMLSAIAVTIFVTRAFNVFDSERQQHIRALQEVTAYTQDMALKTQSEARQIAENWTEALVKINRRIAKMESTDDVLLNIVQKTVELMQVDTVSLGLYDESEKYLQVKYYADQSGVLAADAPLNIDDAMILSMINSGVSHRYPEDVDSPGEGWYCPTVGKKLKAAAIVPMVFEKQPVGGLWIGRFSKSSFTSADLVRLERLADQVVIALEHATMAARLQSLAMETERSRIAREMHDGLLQILGYLNLQMQTLDALVRQDKKDATLEELAQARKHIKAAQEDVRENVLSLRTTLSGEFGFVPALKDYLDEFTVQTGIRAKLIDNQDGSLPPSPIAEAQLVRIVQEALTNVRKHSQAESVLVKFESSNNKINVIIEDNGVGFDHEGKRKQFGLQMMRERVESIGGSIHVESSQGKGTRVDVWIPIMIE